ncbi:predicted protein [Naegleria gruberi]|uniref:Predicted protein n=1 Tax=Naegleria gruberi TaxID=5762 RepID=D2VH08_NAEGR|nr:uncharacterized protein NAEGRDRAFT_68235 [Naegleria gruberi]EFC43808.1 predicted protein [Naegleria gruberi]|eukprot:XP_002676552.1 predicted protein [Naegleria gruberi strain NEG-M]
MIIRQGTYSTSTGGSYYRQFTLRGTSALPIKVYAWKNETVEIKGDAAASQNILNFDVEYFVMDNLGFSQGSRGLRFLNSKHSVYSNLRVKNTGDVGISMNDGNALYQNNTFRYNEVSYTRGTGECFYLGCNNAGCKFIFNLLENNYCHHTSTAAQGDGIEIKTGSYGNVVRNNVIHDGNYPGITLYSTYYNGVDKDIGIANPNIIEGNIIWTVKDNGIQVTGNAIIRNNIIYNAGASGIAIQTNQGIVENVKVLHNTVVKAGAACIRVTNSGPGILIANNAAYCETTSSVYIASALPADGIISRNVIQGSTNVQVVNGTLNIGKFTTDFQGSSALPYNVFPVVSSNVLGKADSKYATTYDFNFNTRNGPTYDCGAYQANGATSNPGWIPTTGFKNTNAPTPVNPVTPGASKTPTPVNPGTSKTTPTNPANSPTAVNSNKRVNNANVLMQSIAAMIVGLLVFIAI